MIRAICVVMFLEVERKRLDNQRCNCIEIARNNIENKLFVNLQHVTSHVKFSFQGRRFIDMIA